MLSPKGRVQLAPIGTNGVETQNSWMPGASVSSNFYKDLMKPIGQDMHSELTARTKTLKELTQMKNRIQLLQKQESMIKTRTKQ